MCQMKRTIITRICRSNDESVIRIMNECIFWTLPYAGVYGMRGIGLDTVQVRDMRENDCHDAGYAVAYLSSICPVIICVQDRGT